MNIGINTSKSGLSGVSLAAYALLSSQFGALAARNMGRSRWTVCIQEACRQIGDTEGEETLAACRTAFDGIVKAIDSEEVKAALAKSGFINMNDVVVTEDGESMSGAARRSFVQKYGQKAKALQQIKQARATAEGYRNIMLKALSAGISAEKLYDMSQPQMLTATKKAEYDALPVEAKEKVDAAVARATIVASMAEGFDAVLSGPHLEAGKALDDCMSMVLVGFNHADDVLRNSFLEALKPWAEKFGEAHDAQKEKPEKAQPKAQEQEPEDEEQAQQDADDAELASLLANIPDNGEDDVSSPQEAAA